MSINLHFTQDDWERIRRDWSAWWAGELQRPLVLIETVEPGAPLPDLPPRTGNLPLDLSLDQVLDLYQARLEARRFYGDAFPKWWPDFGPGIAAGFVGAQVHSTPETGTIWFSQREQCAVSDLHLRYDADNFWWQRIQGLTRRAVERWRGQVAVAHTDLGGNFDILASLRTTQGLLFELYDAPDEVARLSGEITQLWLRYYDESDAIVQPNGCGTTPWAAIWSPGRCYMLQCDFSYMISPKMFERYVLPDLAACCAAMDHGFYHLDGKGQIPHLDMLLSLERLRGIQWIPGDGAPPPEQWLPLLKRIRDGGKLCQLYVTPEGARTIVRELGGRGFALCIQGELSPEEAQDLSKSLASDG
jgi:5-methyltetrahydrofolate--homocysteine methyltransferase